MATDRGCYKRLSLVAITCGPGRMAHAGSTTCPLPGLTLPVSISTAPEGNSRFARSLKSPRTTRTARGGFNPMHSEAWRPRIKRQLRPHQPELSDSAELRIEPPACTGTHGYSSKRNLRRRRLRSVAHSLAHAGDIAVG